MLSKIINEICRGKRRISAEMAMKLSKALKGSPQFGLIFRINGSLIRCSVPPKHIRLLGMQYIGLIFRIPPVGDRA